MVERFNRTIRDLITKYMDAYKTHKYVDVIAKLMKNYNNQVYSGIDITPEEAKEKNFNDIEKKADKNEVIKNINENFKIGDDVNMYRGKKIFEKGNKAYYKSKYTIVGK
jgi:hypothetical protein